MNLFTRRWSPINKFGSMEREGISNACTTKPVANNARMMVTRIESTYSRTVEGLRSCSAIASTSLFDRDLMPAKHLKRQACAGLFCPLLAGAFGSRQDAPAPFHLHGECLLVLGPALGDHRVVDGRHPPRLQPLLER